MFHEYGWVYKERDRVYSHAPEHAQSCLILEDEEGQICLELG